MNEDTIALRIQRRFAASAERVFDAWLDPASARHWFYATPTGRMLRVDIDARVGGGYTVVEMREQGEAAHYGRYLEIDRPHRLVFTLSVDPGKEGDRIVVEIERDGDGCELTLTHTMSAEYADYTQRTREGWTHMLAALARQLGA